MRHNKKINHLSRTSAHRKVMLSNMASSLIEHKRITTTVAKAKALRTYVEPLITKAKNDTTHSRRVVFRYLQNKEAVSELFREVAEKVMERPGGYTRILKTGSRLGDNAEMCIIELVDYNEVMLAAKEEEKKPKRRRRSRRGGSGSGKKEETTATTSQAETPKAEVKEEKNAEAAETNKAEEKTAAADTEAKEDTKTTAGKEEAKDEKAEEKEVKTEAKAEDSKEAKAEDSDEKVSDGEDKEDKKDK